METPTQQPFPPPRCTYSFYPMCLSCLSMSIPACPKCSEPAGSFTAPEARQLLRPLPCWLTLMPPPLSSSAVSAPCWLTPMSLPLSSSAASASRPGTAGAAFRSETLATPDRGPRPETSGLAFLPGGSFGCESRHRQGHGCLSSSGQQSLVKGWAWMAALRTFSRVSPGDLITPKYVST